VDQADLCTASDAHPARLYLLYQVVATDDRHGKARPLVILGPQGVDIRQVERLLVEQAMGLAGGNQSRAAGLLRLSRDQLRYRLEKFGLLKADSKDSAS